MKSIRELLSQQEKTFSFEIFPPKTPEGEQQLFKNLEELQALKPHFISVTMGAMGSNQRNTLDIVQKIESAYSITGVAHLTCIGADRSRIKASIEEMKAKNIRHLLCLRGDPPSDSYAPPPEGFRYANELVEFIRSESGDHFTLGVAGYPEGHIECRSLDEDLRNLKRKVEAGAEFIATQLFFENDDYFDFVDRARKIGIQVPILPGIMPVTSFSQLERFTKVCGAKIPDAMHRDLFRVKDKPDQVREYGVEYAIRQCQNLMQRGAPGLHFYILNQPGPIQRIYEALKLQNHS